MWGSVSWPQGQLVLKYFMLRNGGRGPPERCNSAQLMRRLVRVCSDGYGGMTASLIGHLGSSAFKPSTTTAVSMSLTGSCFSWESAPRPFHRGISGTRWNNLFRGLTVID